jgi:hypothetical protein
VSRELAAGLQACAARQAALHREIARKFKTAWDTSAATTVRTAVREDVVLAEGMEAFVRATEGEDGPSIPEAGGAGVSGSVGESSGNTNV